MNARVLEVNDEKLAETLRMLLAGGLNLHQLAPTEDGTFKLAVSIPEESQPVIEEEQTNNESNNAE